MIIKTLYNLLGINNRLPMESHRLLYLKDKWGLDQKIIGEMEGKSQAYISIALRKARENVNIGEYEQATNFKWESYELKQVQFLPRDMLSDPQAMAFIVDLLGVQVSHPFFNFYTHNPNTRMIALYSMGIQQKKLVEIYKKNQSTIAMQVKRGSDKVSSIEFTGRYDNTAPYIIVEKKEPNKFIQAGGTFIW